jgi:hypothetical protein
MFTTFTPADLVSVLNSVNVPVCVSVFVLGFVIIAIKRAIQRAMDIHRRMEHAENMERLRLSATKEIAATKRRMDDY